MKTPINNRKLGISIFLVLLCVATALSYTNIIKNELKSLAATTGGAEYSVAVFSAAIDFLLLLISLVAGFGVSFYGVWVQNKRRSMLVPASMAGLAALSVIVIFWVEILVNQYMGPRWEYRYTEYAGQIGQGLRILFYFLVGCLVILFICLSVKHLLTQKQLVWKQPALGKWTQISSIVFSIFSLVSLLVMLCQFLPKQPPRGEIPSHWYVSIISHIVTVIIAGIELFLGIRFLQKQPYRKASLGSLLLGSSSFGFFVVWYCIVYTISNISLNNIYHKVFYSQTILCLAVQQVVCTVAILIAAWLCRKRTPCACKDREDEKPC